MKARRIPAPGSIALGAAAGALAASMLRLRRRQRRWGATGEETAEAMPGDDLIPEPQYQTTRAISIWATPATVFAWLIQIGQGRGGFYSFDRLENLAGLNIHSVDRIVPELQRLAVGDVVPLSAIGGPTVVEIEPNTTLILHFLMDPFTGRPIERATPDTRRRFDWTWAFAIRPGDGAGARPVVRTRADYAPRLLLAALAPVLVEPAHFIMELGMLRGIKRRAESTVVAPAEFAAMPI